VKKIIADAFPIYAATEQDAELFMKWVWELRHKNNFDMDVLRETRAILCKASDDSGPLMYLPAHPVLMYESLAPRPDLTNRQTAICLWRIGQVMENAMRDTGMCEAYFITSDQTEAEVCAAHGWTIAMHDPEKKTWLMKRKISNPVLKTLEGENGIQTPSIETEVTDVQ
jgi:hypothetical protein